MAERRRATPTAAEVVQAFREANLTFDLVGQTTSDAAALGRTDLRVLELLTLHGPLHPGQLMALLRLQSASVTGLVDRLVAAGCVRRASDPSDGRRTRVIITPRGRRRWAAAWQRIGTSLDDAVSGCSPAELRVVHDFLVAARRACEASLGLSSDGVAGVSAG